MYLGYLPSPIHPLPHPPGLDETRRNQRISMDPIWMPFGSQRLKFWTPAWYSPVGRASGPSF